MLAAFLRLADELDITYERIPAFLYKHSPPKNPISLAEWRKHWNTTGITFDDGRGVETASYRSYPSASVYKSNSRSGQEIIGVGQCYHYW
jgi:hypothetical protein